MATRIEAEATAAARLLLVAVEPSADAIGARLIAALRQRLPGVSFIGVGGARMRAAGLDSLFDTAPLAVLGLTEALTVYPLVLRRARDVTRLAARERPDAAVLIDAWGFNLRVARALRRLAHPPLLIKYVAPQVWATRPGRARTLARSVDRLLAIHVFDAPFFERAGLPVTFVGNPALPVDAAPPDPASRDRRTLLLLPGSRPAEIRRLLPVFGETVRRLSEDRPELRFILAAADTGREAVAAAVAGWAAPVEIVHGEARRREVMRAATIALACSGTITTELAAAGCPMVVAYRLSPLTYIAARLLIRTRWISLVNIAAGETVAPEFIQGRCTPANLARALGERLDDPESRARQAAAQTRALAVMRGGIADPIAAAAEAVIEALSAGVQPRFSTGT